MSGVILKKPKQEAEENGDGNRDRDRDGDGDGDGGGEQQRRARRSIGRFDRTPYGPYQRGSTSEAAYLLLPISEQKEHKELVPLVCRSSSPCTIYCHTSNHIPSQHKRKLRSLSLCPMNEQLFVTSALDGVVNLWQLQSKGSGASFLSSIDCVSPKQRRWPEDIAWHPLGNSLFCAYTADSGDSQISVLNLNKTHG